MNNCIDQHADFLADVLAGLGSPIKTIPSRWLYDDTGSELFSEITKLTEYYLTRTEIDLLRTHQREIAAFCGDSPTIVEYGAGFGEKTEILLAALRTPESYVTIDISKHALENVRERVLKRFPNLDVIPIAADFLQEVLTELHLPSSRNVVSFFPGSTIGNLSPQELSSFFRNLPISEAGTGKAIIGVDLQQNISKHLAAYDDAEGVTAEFNLNLLQRINSELDGTFPIDRFEHVIRWAPRNAAIEMHLRSRDTTTVKVAGKSIPFTRGETIHTETSRKYTLDGFERAIRPFGWKVEHTWSDTGESFAVFGISRNEWQGTRS